MYLLPTASDVPPRECTAGLKGEHQGLLTELTAGTLMYLRRPIAGGL